MPAGSPTPGGQAWVNPGNSNLFTDASLNGGFGTLGNNGIYFKTNGINRAYLDRNGIAPETGTSVGIGIDPSDSNRITYFSGGGGSTPTWQQVLTAGSILTTDNFVTVSAGTQFTLAGTGGTGGRAAEVEIRTDQASLQASRFGGFSSSLGVTSDSIVFELADGKANINPGFGHGLRNDTDTTSNKPMTYDPVTGMWKYLTYWPSASNTPTWQQTLTAGSTLTTDNTIAGAAKNFTFNNLNSFSAYTTSIGLFENNNSTSTNSISLSNNAIQFLSRKNSDVNYSSSIDIVTDSIVIGPYNGVFRIDTLINLSTQNTLIGGYRDWETS